MPVDERLLASFLYDHVQPNRPRHTVTWRSHLTSDSSSSKQPSNFKFKVPTKFTSTQQPMSVKKPKNKPGKYVREARENALVGNETPCCVYTVSAAQAY